MFRDDWLVNPLTLTTPNQPESNTPLCWSLFDWALWGSGIITLRGTWSPDFVQVQGMCDCFTTQCWDWDGRGSQAAKPGVRVKKKNSLQKIVPLSSKIVGKPQRDLGQFCKQHVLRKANSILASDYHVLKTMFEFLLLGRRFRCPLCKTNRSKFSFIPVAIRLLNDLLISYI